jgi:putative membrane protein
MKFFPAKEVKKFLIIFYTVGVIGFTIPYTRAYFSLLIPLALIMNMGLLFWFNKAQNFRNYSIFLTIAFLAWAIEAVGVETGILFGHYTYGNNLGLKPFNTPILIGLNWLMLSYCAHVFLPIKNKILKIISGAGLLTLYDFILEPSAIFLGMWTWKGGAIPNQNYRMWFITGLLLMSILSATKGLRNPIALPTFGLQLLFFLFINIFTHFI